MIQGSLLSRLGTSVALHPDVILWGDPRWGDGVREMLASEMVGFDLETFGKDKESALNPRKGSIRLLQVGLLSGRSLIADLGGFYDDREQRARDYAEFINVLRYVLESAIVCGTELNFDALWVLVKHQIRIRYCRDVKKMSQVLWAGLGTHGIRMKHNLEGIAKRLGDTIDKSQQLDDWGGILNNKHYNYGHWDAQKPLKYVPELERRLIAAGCYHSAVEAECFALPAFVDIEYNGQPVCLSRFAEVRQAYKQAQDYQLELFHQHYPGINPDSPKQIAAAISAKYNRDFSGAGATEDSTLAALKDPGLDAVAEWRSLGTVTEYGDRLAANLTNHQGDFAISYTHYAQIASTKDANDTAADGAGQGMGRSSSGPPINWQNTPKLQAPWRKLGLPPFRRIVAPPPGYSYLAVDGSQMHARIAAKVSRDPFLRKAYADGYDVHSDLASELAKFRGLDWSPKDIKTWAKDRQAINNTLAEALRNASKNCYYGSLNMQSPKTLSRTCAGAPEPVFLTEDEARFLIKIWREKYQGLYQYQRRRIREVNASSYTFADIGFSGEYGKVIGPTGRNLYLLKSISQFTNQLEVKGTDAVSFIWMGAEADILKRAMGLIWIRKNPIWDLRGVNIVHDELDYIVLSEYALPAATLIFDTVHECMAAVLSPDIPVDDKGAKPEDLIIPDWSYK